MYFFACFSISFKLLNLYTRCWRKTLASTQFYPFRLKSVGLWCSLSPFEGLEVRESWQGQKEERRSSQIQWLEAAPPKKVSGYTTGEGTEVLSWKTKRNKTKAQHGKCNTEHRVHTEASFYMMSGRVLWPELTDNYIEFSNTKATIYWMLLGPETVLSTLQRLFCSVSHFSDDEMEGWKD